MKNSTLIFGILLTTFSLVALGFANRNDSATDLVETSSSKISFCGGQVVEEIKAPDFIYDVESRFLRTFTKEDLEKVRSVADFLRTERIESIVSYHLVSVTILGDNTKQDISETGKHDVLNDAQLNLLRSAPYSANILVQADYQHKNKETGELENGSSTPYITIVPEKQAAYLQGKDALIEFLKENSREQTAIAQEDKLQSGKLYFTITKRGTLSNVRLDQTSGYPSIDQTMIELILKVPGKWQAAENSKGEKVDQTLVFSFGTMGC